MIDHLNQNRHGGNVVTKAEDSNENRAMLNKSKQNTKNAVDKRNNLLPSFREGSAKEKCENKQVVKNRDHCVEHEPEF